MMTEEEKDCLRQEKAEAKFRCRECWETIQQLRKILQSYETAHQRWKRRYERADRQLAEEEKVTKVSVGGEKSKQFDVKLTREQILNVAEQLGISL